MRPYESLRGDAEFARLRRRGRRADGTYVAVVAAPSPRGRKPRVGIATTKGFGDAVDRNRARRRLRAALGVLDFADALDMIVTARTSARTVAFGRLCDDLLATVGKLRR